MASFSFWNKGASEAKKEFRRLARELHPDRGGSSAEFSKLMDAWKAYQGGTQPTIRLKNNGPFGVQKEMS